MSMDTAAQQDPFDTVLDIQMPAEQRVPVVFASPHSGCYYPEDFLAQSALDPQTLRRSEDTYVDDLFAAAPAHGAPLLRARFPRAYIDINREAYELDPQMFDGPLPVYANVDSPRVSAGLGTIARVVSTGAEIYRRKLSFAEAERRIEGIYRPYHATLTRLIEETERRFGCCLIVDCHSMPSIGGPTDADTGTSRFDAVLGDCFGTSCAPFITEAAEKTLRDLGFRVVRNTPYAGGYTTRHYGIPAQGRHTLQIEVNRRLYMNETTHRKIPGFTRLQQDLTILIATLTSLPTSDLRP
ncbi:N-formylglutamate amidohydrolase [Telmatospirillum siberiense]|nr:N-formylglutamate amidohydrolase [Telmatospirillum siberiense]